MSCILEMYSSKELWNRDYNANEDFNISCSVASVPIQLVLRLTRITDIIHPKEVVILKTLINFHCPSRSSRGLPQLYINGVYINESI